MAKVPRVSWCFCFRGTDRGGVFFVGWVGVYSVKGGERDDPGSIWLHRFEDQE